MLAGCGPFGSAKVAQQLQTASQQLGSYQSAAIMSIAEPSSLQQYYVETWFKAPDSYRIALGSSKNEVSQIILHNDKGTYLITPGVKKVMRFQGNWADRQGQFYLYQNLLKDILASQPLRYKTDKELITFVLAPVGVTPYAATEKVLLNRKTFYPQSIVLSDSSQKLVLSIRYTTFKTGVPFQNDAFSPDQATTLKAVEWPVGASIQGFGVVEPAWIPARDTLQDESDQNGVVMIRYKGAAPFTIVENRPREGAVDLGQGRLLTLNGIPAIWTGTGDVHQLYWVNQAVEYTMSARMSQPDFIRVAASTVDQGGK